MFIVICFEPQRQFKVFLCQRSRFTRTSGRSINGKEFVAHVQARKVFAPTNYDTNSKAQGHGAAEKCIN
jgi:hypothetical protein